MVGRWGLPFVGYPCVRAVATQFREALTFVHGPQFDLILAQQYRNGRSSGQAPDTIRQAVRLALPLMPADAAAQVVNSVWGMGEESSRKLVAALQAEKSGAEAPVGEDEAVTLAQRFALALDNRVSAAFSLAEERYQAVAKLSAGIAAVVLAVVFNAGMEANGDGYPLFLALIIGAAAVPLAPIAKDLASALTDALKAWKQVGVAPKA